MEADLLDVGVEPASHTALPDRFPLHKELTGARLSAHATLATDFADTGEGGSFVSAEEIVAPERTLTDVWETPVSRRVIGFIARRRTGRDLEAIRIDPLSIAGAGRSLRWLCSAPQDDIDDWRTSDEHAGAALAAVEEWLQGRYTTFGSALAATFPAAILYDAILACLNPRSRSVLQERAAGVTLEVLAARQNLTRERIRQIEDASAARLRARIEALSEGCHPAAVALFCQVRRLAHQVLAAVTEKAVVLRSGDKRHCIQEILSSVDAKILQVLLLTSEKAKPELKILLDPLSALGWPFQGGRTLSKWRDAHVQALADGFTRSTDNRQRRWASALEVSIEAGLDVESIAVLANFANLTVHRGWVFEGRFKVADVRRAAILGLLSAAGRPMHLAEILEELIPLGFGADSALNDLHRAMAEDPGTFISDGTAIWSCRDQVTGTVEDCRPEHPELPFLDQGSVATGSLDALATAERTETDLLADLALDASFAATAGIRLEGALARLPNQERASIGKLLRPGDQATLVAWLKTAAPNCATDTRGEAEGCARRLEGLTTLAAFVAVLRMHGSSNASYWSIIQDACGQQAQDWLFNSQQAAKRATLSRFAEIACTYNLRRTFAFKSDPWSTLLGVQAGLLPGDLSSVADWLITGRPPVALRQMIAPGPNHSASMAALWHAMLAYRRGHIGREAAVSAFQRNEWWPGWATDDALQAFLAVRTYQPRPVRHGADSLPATNENGVAAPAPIEIDPVEIGPAEGNLVEGDVASTRPQRLQDVPFDKLMVALDQLGNAFSVPLPPHLDVEPGPITLIGDGLRLGGIVQERGRTKWHADEPFVRLPLRGPSVRTVRVERDCQTLASHSLKLWAANDYLRAFTLGPGGDAAFDPFERALPRGRGIALLMHRTLAVSAECDDEHGLDDDYVLRVYRSGLPNGATVSFDQEVLWQAEIQRESRTELPEVVAHLTLDATSVGWGKSTALIFRDPPAGFVPHRVCIGAQVIAAVADGAQWRFPGYALLPGLDNLRRRGRVEGLLGSERVSLRAFVSLANASSSGVVLREAEIWVPLDAEASFDVAKHGRSRVWVCLPPADQGQQWTVFEGPRPVAAYGKQGIRLKQHLFGLGEPIEIRPGRINVAGDDKSPLVAARTINTGIVGSSELSGNWLSLNFATPISWTSEHKALAWSDHGIYNLLPISEVSTEGKAIFAVPAGSVDGVCVFYRGAWLGSWCMASDPARATSSFLADAATSPERLSFALRGRLPILASSAITAAADCVQLASGKGLVALLNGQGTARDDHVTGQVIEHVALRLLETWMPSSSLATVVVRQFANMNCSDNGSPTILEHLALLAPCSVFRVLAQGLSAIPSRERRSLVMQLARCAALRMEPGIFANVAQGHELEQAERRLLDKASIAASLAPEFLASKAGASIAALAWSSATSAAPGRYEANLATCLTIPPVRHWLAVHLLNRTAAEFR